AGGAVWHQCEVRGELLAPRVEVPADIGRAGRLVLVRRGFDADELADFEVFAQRGAEVYRIEPDAPADVGELEEFDERAAARLEITALPVGSWHVYVFGRRGVCPALDLGELELTAAGCEVEVEAPPRGHLRYRCRCADGSAVEQLRAFLADDSGRQVPLREPSGRVTVPAGRWRLFASSTVFPAVLGREIAVVAGCETELDLCLPRGHMRHLAFYLPAGVAPSRCAVHLARDGAPVLGRGTGLTDSGFDHGSDGYCSVAMALADGSYRLELETELGDWFAEFELRGGCDDGEPVLAALRPR
ncbi:MAG: hypothetical protein KDE27_04235, partial [Planctomycetes bacterium]|nr:hypothetical protein [Planctomycetota bacterium]